MKGVSTMREACFTKSLTVAFQEDIYLKIKEITDEKRISMGKWVRIAAEKALSDRDYIECLERGHKGQ
jgi:hypothetical protein